MRHATWLNNNAKYGGERNEREQNLQEEYAKEKFIFETDPNDQNANTLNSAKDTLELFYEEKVKGSNNYPCTSPLARARWEKYEIFSESRKEKPYQKACEEIKYQWFYYYGSIQYLERTKKLLSRVIQE